MSALCEGTAGHAAGAPLNFFERYLTLWVALCIVAGIVLGQLFPGPVQAIGGMEIAKVNLPVGVVIWVMIIPMLLRIDFGALHQVRAHARGIGVTLAVNWLVKPVWAALLAALVLLFAFQGDAILDQPLVIALLAVPILVQVLFNSALAYWLNRLV